MVNLAFTISLNTAASSNVTVTYATSDGTATTANGDYTNTAGTATITAGSTSTTINVPVAGDNTVEPDETLTLTLSNASGATLGTSSAATGTITNDDVAPSAPLNLMATAGNGRANISFTAGANGSSAISNYEFSIDGGAFQALSPAISSSPVTVFGLTNGTAHQIRLRAVNASGAGDASQPVTVTPATVASQPLNLVATAGNAQVSVAFDAPSNNGGANISSYQYSTDGGTTFKAREAGTTASPVVITTVSGGTAALVNGTAYQIQLRAVNSAGNGAASATVTATPVAPTVGFTNQSGSTEPLYTYQWALKKAGNFFAGLTGINYTASDQNDLNVEAVHTNTYANPTGEVKGLGVKVLVLDDGVDIRNEDLIDNVDVTMTRNFDFAADSTADSEFMKFRDSDAAAMKAKDDPTPVTTKNNATVNVDASHGTDVAGIILAAQNNKGVMGIAPRATLGGASYLQTTNGNTGAAQVEAYGGGTWANRADLINASFGSNPETPPSYTGNGTDNMALRAMVPTAENATSGLRAGKGGLFLKATGNEFTGIGGRNCEVGGSEAVVTPLRGKVSCEQSVNDIETLESMVINVAAINSAGVKSSYSNGSSLNWVSGTGGEFGGSSSHGQGTGDGTDGPVMFSTDLRGPDRGYARTNAADTSDFNKLTTMANGQPENANGHYSTMNGTSAATPSVTGVVALILSANPSLGWRDVREILAATSRKLDSNYPTRVSSNKLFNLVAREFTATDATTQNGLVDGSTMALLDYGWQNTGGQALRSAGGRTLEYSTWYGFGLADAKAAVEAAKAYGTGDGSLLRSSLIGADNTDLVFSKIRNAEGGEINLIPALSYGKVTKLGQFPAPTAQIEQVQLRVSSGQDKTFCVGSTGFAVRAPDGKVSLLSTPLNTFYSSTNGNNPTAASNYTLGSYAYFGSALTGNFEVFAITTRPTAGATDKSRCGPAGNLVGGAEGSNAGFDNIPTDLVVEYRVLPRVLTRKDNSTAPVGIGAPAGPAP